MTSSTAYIPLGVGHSSSGSAGSLIATSSIHRDVGMIGAVEAEADFQVSASARRRRVILVFGSIAAFAALCYLLEFHVELRVPHSSVGVVLGRQSEREASVSLEGVYAPNDHLHKVVKLFKGQISGSESAALAPDGSLVLIDKYGTVFRAADPRAVPQPLANMGAGRPLGFEFDASGNLLVCNAPLGLQRLPKGASQPELLASGVKVRASDGSEAWSPIVYANGLALARNGSIYFTDSCDVPPVRNADGFYDTAAAFIASVYKVVKAGRVLRYDPATRETTVVYAYFGYCNGLVLAEDESYLLVSETALSRIQRLWLTGPKAGTAERFLKTRSLPYHPDGISRGLDGSLWVAMVAPRMPFIEAVWPSKLVRFLLSRSPEIFRPRIKRASAIAQVSSKGEVLRFLADTDGSHVSSVSAVTEAPDGLYLGNLLGDYVGFLAREDLPPIAAAPAAT